MRTRRGFTLIEAGFIAASVAGLVGLGAVSSLQPEPEKKPMPAPENRRAEPLPTPKAKSGGFFGSLMGNRAQARQIGDSTRVRGLCQGLIMFAQNNDDKYPLPSEIDKGGTTVDLPGEEKNTTANILSVLIWNGFFGPELLVSAAETNKRITLYKDYSFTDPKSAVTPAEALWDPSLTADFVNGTGSMSFAMRIPSVTRRTEWAFTFNAAAAVVGNRGPRVEGLRREGNALVPLLPGTSNTYAIHGSKKAWEGNVSFNDNHVEFMQGMTSIAQYVDRRGARHPDNHFYNEPDDAKDTNSVLGIYIRAGNDTKFFQGIWD